MIFLSLPHLHIITFIQKYIHCNFMAMGKKGAVGK